MSSATSAKFPLVERPIAREFDLRFQRLFNQLASSILSRWLTLHPSGIILMFGPLCLTLLGFALDDDANLCHQSGNGSQNC